MIGWSLVDHNGGQYAYNHISLLVNDLFQSQIFTRLRCPMDFAVEKSFFPWQRWSLEDDRAPFILGVACQS
jgi:hypothetical protein